MYEKLEKTVDREVVEQYVQYPKIAKDFANYLELYYKYRTDYQIDAVLSGSMDENLLKKIKHASFDERLSVVSLILAKLTGEFRNVYRLEAQTRVLFSCLKSYKNGLSYAEDGSTFFGTVLEETREEYENKKKAELLNREEGYAYRTTLETLEMYWMKLKKENLTEKEACFEYVRELFAMDKNVYTGAMDKAGQMLEYAFDFMEVLFGESQEMVAFMTELNANFYSIQFLKEYECERYYQYNKNLLFDEKEKTLLSRIERL